MRKVCSLVVILICNVFALWQACLGLMQLFGLRSSNNVRYVLTGSFDNPGPYGGALAILMAVTVTYVVRCSRTSGRGGFMYWVSIISSLLCFIILPATMSRAAWFSLGVAMLLFGLSEYDLLSWSKHNKVRAAVICLFLLIVSAGVFLIKKDSALGRLHIWHMEVRAIIKNPWTGTGKGTILGTYGKTQAEYFAAEPRNATIVRIAGCPEYAFNEYLKVGVERGLPRMLCAVVLSILILVALLRFLPPAAYGFCALIVFSFFSYPLSAIRIETEAEKQWKSIRYMSNLELYNDFIEELELLYEDLHSNYRYLYDLGYALHKIGDYERSNKILVEGSKISSDPMFHNILGKNHMASGKYDLAEKEFLLSHHMVPSRIYPLFLLMTLKISISQNVEAIEVGEKVIRMNVNERNSSMVEMRNQCKHKLDSLKNVLCSGV